jgi:hypothetical protein
VKPAFFERFALLGRHLAKTSKLFAGAFLFFGWQCAKFTPSGSHLFTLLGTQLLPVFKAATSMFPLFR